MTSALFLAENVSLFRSTLIKASCFVLSVVQARRQVHHVRNMDCDLGHVTSGSLSLTLSRTLSLTLSLTRSLTLSLSLSLSVCVCVSELQDYMHRSVEMERTMALMMMDELRSVLRHRCELSTDLWTPHDPAAVSMATDADNACEGTEEMGDERCER